MSSTWLFEQLGGKHRRLELADHAAPHGRPRQGSVVDTEDIYRQSETYYPGFDVPTRHLFGAKQAPVKLKGRLRDAWGGNGFARRKRDEIRVFASEMQSVRVTWDDAFSIVGLITNVHFGLESKHEIPYEIEIAIDRDLFLGRQVKPREIKSPQNLTAAIVANMQLAREIPTTPPTMKGSVFELLDSLVSVVGAATDQVVHVAAQINSFATAPFHTLARFRAALGQLRTAIVDLRGTYDQLTTTIALESQSSNERDAMWDMKAAWGASSLEAMRDIARAEQATVRAEQGQILLFYTAKEQETWETISVVAYGAAARAGEIARANSVPVGQNPVPGTVYLVPR